MSRHKFKVNASLAIQRQIKQQMHLKYQLALPGVGQWFIDEIYIYVIYIIVYHLSHITNTNMNI